MAARAFQSYVEDRLSEKTRRNDYLSAKADNKYYQGQRPFPAGDERNAINAAFDNLMRVMHQEKGFKKAMSVFMRRSPTLLFFSKAYIHGHYRINKKTGQRIWVDSYQDKRPERGRTEFAHWNHRKEHFKHHLAYGRQREALHAFHDLDSDKSHKLAAELGLHNGEKHDSKKELMQAVHGNVREAHKALQKKVMDQVKADFEKRQTKAKNPKSKGRQSSIAAVVDIAAQPKRDGNQVYHIYRAVTPDEAKKAKEKQGGDISGYEHGIDEAAVRHIFKSHGNAATEAARGQVAVTREDFLQLPEITDPDKADSVEYGLKTESGLPAIRYKKRINGHIVVVEEVREGRNRLALKTLWKTRAARDMSDQQTPPPTAEPFGARSAKGKQSIAPPTSQSKPAPRTLDANPDALDDDELTLENMGSGFYSFLQATKARIKTCPYRAHLEEDSRGKVYYDAAVSPEIGRLDGKPLEPDITENSSDREASRHRAYFHHIQAALESKPGLGEIHAFFRKAWFPQRGIGPEENGEAQSEEKTGDVMSKANAHHGVDGRFARTPDVRYEKRQLSELYDYTLKHPLAAPDAMLVTLKAQDLSFQIDKGPAIETANGQIKVTGRKMPGRGYGMVKVLWKHGQHSGKPDGERVTRSDVLALPEIVRSTPTEIVEDNQGKLRAWEWRRRRFDGQTVVYAASRFSDTDNSNHVVTIYIDSQSSMKKAAVYAAGDLFGRTPQLPDDRLSVALSSVEPLTVYYCPNAAEVNTDSELSKANAHHGVDGRFAFAVGECPGLFDKPPIQVTLSRNHVKPSERLSEAGARAKQKIMVAFAELGGAIRNRDSRHSITVTGASVNHLIHLGEKHQPLREHIEAAFCIPDLIRRAVLAERHPDRKDGNPNLYVARYFAPFSHQGKLHRCKLTVFEHREAGGAFKLYDHALSSIDLEPVEKERLCLR
jgi:hypothetical protein